MSSTVSTPHASRASLALLAVLVLLGISTTGCRWIYEPADDSVVRLMEALEARDKITVKDLVKDEQLQNDLNTLSGVINSGPYRSAGKVWRIVEVEEDAETDLTYVYVEFDVVRSGGRPRTMEIIFEMKRDLLRWEVLDVIDLGLVLKKAGR